MGSCHERRVYGHIGTENVTVAAEVEDLTAKVEDRSIDYPGGWISRGAPWAVKETLDSPATRLSATVSNSPSISLLPRHLKPGLSRGRATPGQMGGL